MTYLEYLKTMVANLLVLAPLGWIALKYLAKRLTEGVTGYVTEKGKNLATKQDIEGITKKVEGVRYEFSARLADLNADIQKQLNLFGKRNEALTQFYDDSSVAASFLRTPVSFSHEDLDGFDRHSRQGQECIVRADLSYRRLRLYVQEESILTAAEKARTAFNTLHITWFEKMVDCRDAFIIEAAQWRNAFGTGDYSFFEGGIYDRPTSQAFDKLGEAINDPLNALDDSLKEYAKALYAHFHPADNSKALAATTCDSLEK
jgi:hypothetical protein